MKKKIFILLVFFIAIALIIYAAKNHFRSQNYKDYEERETFRIVFYNTENLYDITDDPEIDDEDFTPEGKLHWSYTRYDLKLQHISKVLTAIGGWRLPEMICLAEIENRNVLEDLVKKTPLSNGNYEIIHKESPDKRGIDVALLYEKNAFRPLYYQFIRIDFPEPDEKPTRDILYACGIINLKDTIHLFVAHWPSRSGGTAESEPKRCFVASVLKAKTDSIVKSDKNAKIIITGDLNDDPDDKSIVESLVAGSDTTLSEKYLYNFMVPMKKRGEGTLKYKNEWNLFDQFIVSVYFFNKNDHLFTTTSDAHIFRADFLLKTDDKYPGDKPFRTFSGPQYLGGFSDHLPVYLDLRTR